MKVHDDHHHYSLPSFENPMLKQDLFFIKKEPTAANDGALQTIHDGTTNEEVLKMLVHRLNGLQAKFPCRENAVAITHIETALLWLEKRTADRKARGVEGKQLK